MLKENQIERTVLFHENVQGQKIQMEYSDGAMLDQVANLFKNFLRSTGYDYISDVEFKAVDGTVWSTHEPPIYSSEEEEDDLPF